MRTPVPLELQLHEHPRGQADAVPRRADQLLPHPSLILAQDPRSSLDTGRSLSGRDLGVGQLVDGLPEEPNDVLVVFDLDPLAKEGDRLLVPELREKADRGEAGLPVRMVLRRLAQDRSRFRSVRRLVGPGDMGSGFGRDLHARGHDVITCLAGRGEGTRSRAAEAGFRDVPDLDALVCEAELVLAILPPELAVEVAGDVAEAMRRTGARPVYADCNTISPDTTRNIATTVTAAGADYIDGGIIGHAPPWYPCPPSVSPTWGYRWSPRRSSQRFR